MTKIENERRIIEQTRRPITRASLAADLRALGVRPGMTLLVHSAMSRLGWVAGGPVAVVLALQDVITPAGTLIMPAFSTDNSDPAHWQNPPVPEDWWPIIRAETPAFDPHLTPTRGMGAIAECFRTGAGVRRSDHPSTSFCAWGAGAEAFTVDHPVDCILGERSPLARLYHADGHILLLGVGHGNNTSLHLSEYRTAWPGKAYVENGAAMLVDGVRQWVTVRDLDVNDEDFPQIGAAYEAAAQPGDVTVGAVGQAETRLLRQRPLVDFGVAWMEQNRGRDGV